MKKLIRILAFVCLCAVTMSIACAGTASADLVFEVGKTYDFTLLWLAPSGQYI